MFSSTLFISLHFIIVLMTVLRVLIRPNKEPATRIAWIAVIDSLPILGVLAYLFFGEVNIGRKYNIKMKKVLDGMPAIAGPKPECVDNYIANTPVQFEHLFKLGKSINGYDPVGGNTAELMSNSRAMIESLVADIDAAQNHVHLLFYIWLPDNSGCKVVEALKRAASRGIKCRVMADSIGSKAIIQSEHWQAMQDSGVHLAKVLPIGNPLLRGFRGRVDLRNHRKIVVIDGSITYCGSQNCADAEFLPKAKFGPWVDAVFRIEGPVASQNQHLFASDWMVYSNEDIKALLHQPIPASRSGFTAQVIGTGPNSRRMAMSQIFVAIIASARKELIITTPYFVPDEAIQNALQAAAYQDVQITIVFPAKNDSWIVQAASRSYYQNLLDAGITIYEYTPGLLHTKSISVDGEFAMIGSANLDRRSFDLNYENNMLISDTGIVADMIERQQQYISQSKLLTIDAVASWSLLRRLWNNSVAVISPVL